MTVFGFVKFPGKNVALEVVGGYPTDEECRAIESAGWFLDEAYKTMPRIPEDYIEDYIVTETFHPAAGSDLFGGHTKAEDRAHRGRLRRAFARAGMRLTYSRQGRFEELL